MTATVHKPYAGLGQAAATSARRLVNDQIAYVAASTFGDDPTSVYEFLCECGDLRCRGQVALTLQQYGEVVTSATPLIAH